MMIMTLDLKRYPAYKDSGVEWLGKVPSHWDVWKLRHTIRSVTERNRPDLPLLSVVRERGVVVRDISHKDENHNFIPDDLTNYKVVNRYQFAMNKMKAWQGSYGVSDFHGIVSPAYFVFDIEGTNPDYFHTAIRSKAYVPFFTRASDGVRIGQWDLSVERMREIPFLIPPVEEQTAIVHFLDHADRRIRRNIRAKQKQIALLEEQKQAIIHHAVTGQIDVRTGQPYPAYKDSGVTWLAYVPAHWEIRRLRTFATVINGATPSSGNPQYWDGEITWITPEDLGRLTGCVIDRSARQITIEGYGACGTQLAPAGSIAISTRAPIGHLAILSVNACVNQGCRLLVPSGRVLSHYLYRQLSVARSELVSLGQGTTFTELSRGKLVGFRVALPPLTEQGAIVQHIDRATARIDTGIARASSQVELMREYRTRLIADVVTGKLDVREAAAELPEEDVPGDAEELAEEYTSDHPPI